MSSVFGDVWSVGGMMSTRLAKESGANIFASGSYIFKRDDVDRAVNELKKAVMEAGS